MRGRTNHVQPAPMMAATPTSVCIDIGIDSQNGLPTPNPSWVKRPVIT